MTEAALRRELNLLNVFCITAGAMISAEIFILPGIAYAKAGPAVVLSFLVAGVIALPTMLSAAELVSAMPKAGGIYYFTSRSMGFAAGTIVGFSRWFAISLKSAFALIGIGVYTAAATETPITEIAIILYLLFILINLLGVKLVGHTQLILLTISVSIFLLYLISGLNAIDYRNFTPLMPYGIDSVFSTAGFVFISYGALLMVTSLAEEVKEPEKNIPLGMFLSLVSVMVLYMLLMYTTVSVLTPEEMMSSITPLSDAARKLAGPMGAAVILIALATAAISTTNSGITSASRYPLAMSRDKILLEYLYKINHKHRIPYFSVLLTGGFMVLVILFLQLKALIEVASTLLILSYILTNIAVIEMRKKKGYNPTFQSPLYPWTQMFGTIGLIALIIEMGELPILLSLVFIIAALLWYRFYAYPRISELKN